MECRKIVIPKGQNQLLSSSQISIKKFSILKSRRISMPPLKVFRPKTHFQQIHDTPNTIMFPLYSDTPTATPSPFWFGSCRISDTHETVVDKRKSDRPNRPVFLLHIAQVFDHQSDSFADCSETTAKVKMIRQCVRTY